MRSTDHWTNSVRTAGRASHASWCSRSSCPVLEAGLYQGDSYERYSRTGNKGRKNTLQYRRLCEGQANLKKRAQASGSNQRTIAVRAWQLRSIRARRTKSCCIHLRKGPSGHRDNGEACSDDRDQSSANIIRRFIDVESSDLNRRQNSTDDQGCRHQILRVVCSQGGASLARDND